MCLLEGREYILETPRISTTYPLLDEYLCMPMLCGVCVFLFFFFGLLFAARFLRRVLTARSRGCAERDTACVPQENREDLHRYYVCVPRSFVSPLTGRADHITHCEGCRGKGFVCERCGAKEVIFSFQKDTTRCLQCKSLYLLRFIYQFLPLSARWKRETDLTHCDITPSASRPTSSASNASAYVRFERKRPHLRESCPPKRPLFLL